MGYILKLISLVGNLFRRFWVKYILRYLYRSRLGYCGKNVDLRFDRSPVHMERIFMYDDTNIYQGFSFISAGGKFIMKSKSGAATGLTVITGNHQRVCGTFLKDISGSHKYDIERDVIVEEEVWLATNVTLLSGVTIGRGATVGAGSVCFKSVPPYAIVIGNPAKVIGFVFTPEEIIEHEKKLYQPEERLSLSLLKKNYEKYFLSRRKEIKAYLSLLC